MAIVPSVPTTPFTPIDEDTGASISTVHPDIIQTHILNRLDGAALTSLACASSQLRGLCEQNLWRRICTSTWPSLENPLVRDVVSTFPGGYRSIFSDSFPSLHHASPVKHPDHSFLPSKFISAVDLYYQGKPIFSKVQWIETGNVWFLSSPLWIELLEPEELVPTPIKYVGKESKDEEWLKHLEENLSLSCILIDPTQKRSANLSSRSPIFLQRHWLTRDLEIIYAVLMAGNEGTSEFVQCRIKVTCGGIGGGGDMHVTEVSLMFEDMDGRPVNGRESMIILQRAIQNGGRKKLKGGEAKESHEKFWNIKSKRREKKLMREKAMDMLTIFIAISIFILFCWFVFF